MADASLEKQVKTLLAKHVAFSLLAEEDIARWAECFEPVSFALGETICYDGEPGDCAYLVQRGKVRVSKQGKKAGMSLGVFTEGDLFGGHSRPEHWPRTLSIRAAEPAHLFKIARADFERLLADYLMLVPYFDKPLAQAILLRSLRLTALLGAVPEDAIPIVLEELDECRFPAGTTILREGEVGDRLYVIKSGAVSVSKRFHDQERPLTDLGEGEYFGERALLLGEPRHGTVVARTDTHCFSLGREGFDKLSRSAPQLKHQLARRLHVYLVGEERARQAADVVLVRIARADVQRLRQEQPALTRFFERSIDQAKLLQFLRLTRFLDALPAPQVLAVLNELQECRFPSGAAIIRAGGPVHRLYVIRSGSAKRARNPVDPAARDDLLHPGESIGQEWLLSERPADASIIALQKTECFYLDRASLERLAIAAPDLGPCLVRVAEASSAGVLRREHGPRRTNPSLPAPPPRQPSRFVTSLSIGERPGARYPWLGQRDQNDCGLAALAMIARFHGFDVSVKRLHELIDLEPEGTSLLSLGLAAAALGLDWRAVLTDFNELAGLPLPAIAHWKDTHYVVLYALKGRKVLLADPAVGLIKMSRRLFERDWSRRLLLLRPASCT